MSRTYLRGDLYYADLGHGIGSEQKGTRPVVIIQNNVGNKYSPTVIIAAITSKANVKAKLPTHYYLDAGNGLAQPSLVLLEQIRTVDKRRLSSYIGRLDENHIRGINHALAVSIGLIEPVPPKLTLCLCGACANAFRGTGAFALREAAPEQAEKEVCVYCGQRPGMEYVVTPKGGAGV
ncbi:type II toxin-antitoxin system PemK/MazF family toxin [Butyricicoccus sp. 1XD8-22]|nr:type II toxin-antitoxin system PemK/MazF family toxin [Butyricicoccus sp. 1XD8-22]